MSSTHGFLRTENRSNLSWSCKALNHFLAIHFNASVTFLLRVLEICIMYALGSHILLFGDTINNFCIDI